MHSKNYSRILSKLKEWFKLSISRALTTKLGIRWVSIERFVVCAFRISIMSLWFLSQQKFKCSRPNTIIRPCKPSFRLEEFSTNTYLRTLRDYKTIKSIHIMRGMSLIGMAEQEVGTINYNVSNLLTFLSAISHDIHVLHKIIGESHPTEAWENLGG